MLQEITPLQWWSDFLSGELTAAEARAYLGLTAFEWLSIPGLTTSRQTRSYGKYQPTQDPHLHPTVVVSDAMLFGRWIEKHKPEHHPYLQAALTAAALEKETF